MTSSQRPKPRKRPSQARAKFTVQAIYDAFVRIWREEGPQAVTTRSVALVTGVAVGTLYDYFPNKQALLSGYVRHCIELLVTRIEAEVIADRDRPWPDRLRLLVRLTCGIDGPYFDAAMLHPEARIAEPKHHRRVYEELSGAWLKAFATFDAAVAPATVRTLFVMAWGARRYLLLVPPPHDDWIAEFERLCLAACIEQELTRPRDRDHENDGGPGQ